MDRSKFLISGGPSLDEAFIHAGGEGGPRLAGGSSSAGEPGAKKLAPGSHGGSRGAKPFDDGADDEDEFIASW